MKKAVKNLLLGVGIAAVGLIAYSVWKDTEEPAAVQDADCDPVSTTLSKEYVERRRRQIREAAEARKAAQERVAVLSAEEKPQEPGEGSEENETLPDVQEAAPVEPAPLEQSEGQQEEL